VISRFCRLIVAGGCPRFGFRTGIAVLVWLTCADCSRRDTGSFAVASETLELFSGEYQASPETRIAIRREDTHLRMSNNLGTPMVFNPEGPDLFLHRESGTRIRFVRDTNLGVRELILIREGEHHARRISEGGHHESMETVRAGKLEFRRLITGRGDTTVVLLGGLSPWTPVRTKIEPLARVISCEIMAGGDEGKPAILTAQEQAESLEEFLTMSGVNPPFLLVAHSFGGALARLYADRFPGQVSGLVLVDPFHEGLVDWLEVHQPDALRMLREECQSRYVSDWTGLMEGLRKARIPQDVPVVVLTAGRRRIRSGDSLEEGLDPILFDAASRATVTAHQEWASSQSRGRHVLVAESGHEIAQDSPEAVVDAVRDVVERWESK